MRFLIIAPRFHTNLYYRCLALQNEGHTVKVVVLYKGKSEFYNEIDIQLIKLSILNRFLTGFIKLLKKNYLKTTFELRIEVPNKALNKIFKEYRPNAVLLKAYQNALAIKTLLIAKHYKAKTLMLIQTPYTHIKGSERLFRWNILLFKFLKVHSYITPIKENYDAFKAFGIQNVYYLPFVFPKQIINISEKQINTINILSIGKFQKRKDQLLLLHVFNKLKKENYDIKLCLIGEAVNTKYIKSLHYFIKENNLSDVVCIKTNMPYKKILEEYKKYDLFILPAYNEPAAYSPVEAMANGLPVICSDENGTKCYIEEGKNGFIFNAKNETDLKEKIKLLISKKETLREMQKNALFLANKNHNPKDFAKEIKRILFK